MVDINGDNNVSFRVERDDLSDAAAWVARSLPTKNTQPILRAVVITVDDDVLYPRTFAQKLIDAPSDTTITAYRAMLRSLMALYRTAAGRRRIAPVLRWSWP